MYWFSPSPSEVSSSRLSLDFDLRSADLFFRELVVPELGRVWFVRQLSWPLAALSLYEELKNQGSSVPKPTAICHGIEALACKLEFHSKSNQDERSSRILGVRAFGRDDGQEDAWSFNKLCQASHYVRNTHRQAATRAIRVDGGLGFARGSRFDLLELEPVGRSLADVFLKQPVGQGRTSLGKWLKAWLFGKNELPASRESFRKALSPECATKDEQEQVRSRLLGVESPGAKNRNHLSDAVGRTEQLRDIEKGVVERLRKRDRHGQADEILAARAFGAMLDRARDAVASLTHAVESGRGGVKLATLATDSNLQQSFSDLRLAANNYLKKAGIAKVSEPTSGAFADAVTAANDNEVIKLLVRRAGEVFGLADDYIVRGPLFRVVDATDEAGALADGAVSIEPDRTGRTFRIANFHALLRDVDQQGAR